MRWTMTGRSDTSTRPALRGLLGITLSLSKGDFVKVEEQPHTNSQASSQGQVAQKQPVTAICEDCEANFLKGQRKKNINRNGS